MMLLSSFSFECFQVSPVDWHWSGHCHWTLILPHWLLQLPLVPQEGSTGNKTRASPANVNGDGLSMEPDTLVFWERLKGLLDCAETLARRPRKDSAFPL